MEQTHKIQILPKDYYVFEFGYMGHSLTYGGCGEWLIENIFKGIDKIPEIEAPFEDRCICTEGPQQDYLGLLKHELKQLHVALSRAIEEGDSLKIGIVLGQTVSKLEEIINK